MNKNHPWMLLASREGKLKKARAEAKRRSSLKHRNENIEWKRVQERNWHRKKLGIPLDAPLISTKEKQARSVASRMANKRARLAAQEQPMPHERSTIQ